jgi:hypothetical protein
MKLRKELQKASPLFDGFIKLKYASMNLMNLFGTYVK